MADNTCIITACKNRIDHLKQVLPSWKKFYNKIIVIDWSSDVPVELDGVTVYRIDNKPDWILSIPFNEAAFLTKEKYLLKLDCDYELLESLPLPQEGVSFFCGDWKQARQKEEVHLNGALFISRNDFLKVGGYNEHIQSYGYEDSDLYERLEKIPLQRKNFQAGTMRHLHHSNKERSSKSDLNLEIRKNMFLSKKHPWSLSSRHSLEPEFNRIHNEDEFYLLGLRSILHTDFDIGWSFTGDLSVEEMNTMRKKRRKLYIQVKNGLGNRLRALASAQAIAEATDRQLLVYWPRDNHCDCSFSDLFSTHLPVSVNHFEGKLSSGDLDTLLKQDMDIYLSSACTLKSKYTSWEKECKYLRSLSFSKEVQKIISSVDVSNCVGVHVRMGQQNYSFESTEGWDRNTKEKLEASRKESHYTVFIEEMTRRPTNDFFVAADSQEIYDAMIRKFGSRIKYLKRQVFDRSREQLFYALADVVLLSKCVLLLGSPWSSFTELASRLGATTIIAGRDFGVKTSTHYGVLSHSRSMNLGDTIQSLSIIPYLPENFIFVDRDLAGKDLPENVKSIKVIYTGWFDKYTTAWPPCEKIVPLFLGFHVNEKERPNSNYQALIATKEQESMTHKKHYRYYLKHSPIGCRDSHTMTLFNYIPKYLSFCPTILLERKHYTQGLERKMIVVVDSNILFPDAFKAKVPEKVRKEAAYRYHGLSSLIPTDEKIVMAKQLLQTYADAKYVITSRLHCALPCLAFGTPVYFIYEGQDVRFTGYEELLNNTGWNWESPEITSEKQTLIERIRREQEQTIRTFLDFGTSVCY